MAYAEQEKDVRKAVAVGDIPTAVTLALAAYGAETFGFLLASVDDRLAARELYARVQGRLRTSLAQFTWHTSLRAWIYALAWQELAPERLPRRCGLPGDPTEPSSPEPATTIAARPVFPSSAVIELRASLTPMDHGLLILCVDRGLTPTELAMALAREGASADAIARASSALEAHVHDVRTTLTDAAVAKRLVSPVKR
jgi:hypothetical protein